LNLDLSETTGS